MRCHILGRIRNMIGESSFVENTPKTHPFPPKKIFSGAIYGFKITIGFVVIYLVLTVETIA